MKCPNCNSHMLIAEQTANTRSLVKFFRCTNCVGGHVSSQPLSAGSDDADSKVEFFGAHQGRPGKQFQIA